MGFFSWKTLDTHESIANSFSNKPTFRVWLMDNNGNCWREDNYNGYGVFGGKDYYELLAEMNGKTTRDEGIDIAFAEDRGPHNTNYPNLVRYADDWDYINDENDLCEGQGYWLD